jgi:hypothetical protein
MLYSFLWDPDKWIVKPSEQEKLLASDVGYWKNVIEKGNTTGLTEDDVFNLFEFYTT